MKGIAMTELPAPGNYWLVTEISGRVMCTVTEDGRLLIRQGPIAHGYEHYGYTWWEPDVIDEETHLEPRV